MNAPTILGAAAGLYSSTFFLGALLHAGVRVSLGFAVLAEPVTVPAVIVEGAAAVALGISAYALLSSKPWAWPAAIGAHMLALGGVLLGMAAIAAGRGPHSVLNDTYHRVMVVLLLASLLALSTPLVHQALRSHADRAR